MNERTTSLEYLKTREQNLRDERIRGVMKRCSLGLHCFVTTTCPPV